MKMLNIKDPGTKFSGNPAHDEKTKPMTRERRRNPDQRQRECFKNKNKEQNFLNLKKEVPIKMQKTVWNTRQIGLDKNFQ